VLTRRRFLAASATVGAGVFLVSRTGFVRFVRAAEDPGALLDPLAIPQFRTPLLIPPVMPRSGTRRLRDGRVADCYEISMRQFEQQILPDGLPATTVWGYGAVRSASRRGIKLHHAPSLTIEAVHDRPVQVKWINELVDADGHFLPHLLPVDPTLHWANPGGGHAGRDSRPIFESTPGPYRGPVPVVTHVHGAVGVGDESDGYAEAWFLPDADDIPDGYAREGRWYDFFRAKAFRSHGTAWRDGSATFTYPNRNRASTIWYHDHALGMTRLNVYAGPAGFYLVRGGSADVVRDRLTGRRAVLPGPAPKAGDPFPTTQRYYEIPIAIQDRTFRSDGSLFYPDSRTLFDGIVEPYLPDAGGNMEGFSPVWNPEFFGNTMMVNGATWPYLDVERRRYRFRFLNGCDSRFLILDLSQIPGVRAWQIGNEGGFLPAPVDITGDLGNRLLLGLAERADVIVDFGDVPAGEYVLGNLGPDEPYGGGEPDQDFDAAEAATTGRILQFRVAPGDVADPTTPPERLRLPRIGATPPSTLTRPLALIEMMGMGTDAAGNAVEGPVSAALGNVYAGMAVPAMWMMPVTENPAVGATETWEFWNTTGDAHPMHIHEVVFEVLSREGLRTDPATGELVEPLELDGNVRGPEPHEAGFKDTVTAYPGEVTRVKATFATPGQFTWHCHIVSHEDNEMMRPYRIGPSQRGEPKR
jgi:spore coat protein A, manganese oxidase